MTATSARSVSATLDAARHSAMSRPFRVERPWKSLIGFVILAAILGVVFFFVVVFIVVMVPSLRDAFSTLEPLPETTDRLIEESKQAVALAAVLASVALAVVTAAALIYRRHPREFLWPERSVSGRDLVLGFLTISALGVALIPLYLLIGSEWSPPILNPLYADWTRPAYLVVTTGAILIAAAAEEVVFRGVLLRLTALVTRHPLILCLINGLIFSAIHLDPDPVGFVARALSGMVWTWATLRLGGLEFAIGAHAATNLIICLFWAPISEASLSRDSAWIELAPEIITSVVTVAIIEWIANGRRDRQSPGLASRTAA